MREFDTLTDALHDLEQRGFRYNFNVASDSLHCPELNLKLHPDEFEVVEFYRFEGPTDPADSSIVYAIESPNGTKGVLVNAYGVYADPGSSELVQKLNMHV